MLLDEMEMFYHIIELGSFTKAAQKLEVSKSLLSKKMTKLEQALKIRLITRNTRKITLTEAGRNFYLHCANIVQEAEKGFSMMSELQEKPMGKLKISLPPALAIHLLAPMLANFIERYPEVHLDIRLDNHQVDLIQDGFDFALRFAKLEDSSLIAQKIFNIKHFICATPQYFLKFGQPKKPNDLKKHLMALYNGSKNMGKIDLTSEDNALETVYIEPAFSANHLDLIKKMVLDHQFMGIFPEFMVQPELQENKLETCLYPNYQLSTHDLYLIYPEKKFRTPKVQYFFKMLKDYLQN